MTAVIVGLIAGCSTGHGAASPPRPAHAPPMARPAPYSKIDLRFVDRAYVYTDDALMLARLAATRPADPRIAQLAAGLRTVQQGNVQELSGWLLRWGKKPPTMPVSSAGGSWPGLATASQIKRMGRLSSAAFDRKFLKVIIADQRGELSAATIEQEGGTFGPGRQLASQIVSTSTLAIVRMTQLLKLTGTAG
jgi:uncharacterized protein (DUF305 family)